MVSQYSDSPPVGTLIGWSKDLKHMVSVNQGVMVDFEPDLEREPKAWKRSTVILKTLSRVSERHSSLCYVACVIL